MQDNGTWAVFTALSKTCVAQNSGGGFSKVDVCIFSPSVFGSGEMHELCATNCLVNHALKSEGITKRPYVNIALGRMSWVQIHEKKVKWWFGLTMSSYEPEVRLG